LSSAAFLASFLAFSSRSFFSRSILSCSGFIWFCSLPPPVRTMWKPFSSSVGSSSAAGGASSSSLILGGGLRRRGARGR